MSISTFFEGPEKKLELSVVEGHPSLRGLGDEFWRRVVASANAQVLSHRENGVFDAYLLSESSLFVFDDFVTMITCGRTTLAHAVDTMLERIPADAVSVLVYERKNEHFPYEQPMSFYEDARHIGGFLPGRALRFGNEHEHSVRLFHTLREHEPRPTDCTLEVLMHGLAEDVVNRFRDVESPSVGTLAERLGLERTLGGFDLDEHFFEPFGYSLNALRDASYATLHITPQSIGSYVSFETNAPETASDPSSYVQEVVACFKPESFDVVYFHPDTGPVSVDVPGYDVRQHVHEPLCGYDVTFQHFFLPCPEAARAVVLPI